MDYDERGFAASSDGTRLFYGVAGPKRVDRPSGSRFDGTAPALRGGAPVDLVLLDGIGCDGWAWEHIQPELSRNHRVVHTHYRGHGRSAQPADPDKCDVPSLADDVVAVMDTARVDGVVLLGHSMGTQVALEVYRRVPQRVRALILICGSYGRITHTFHGNDLLHRWLPTLIESVSRHRGIARALWGRLPPMLAFRIGSWIGEIDGATLPAEDFRKYVEHLSDIDLDVYLKMLQLAGDHSAEDVLDQVRVPTLVIAAEKDTFTPVDVVRALAERIPDAQYIELVGASHAAPIERASAINEYVGAFLDRLG
jgi:pimeloyl-ACP methyl ester carboxylesterase